MLALGLTVARAAARVAQVEGQAADALGDGAVEASRALMAPHDSLGAAAAAGQGADISDAARDKIAARLAMAVACFDKAARAVRRTVALRARLAEGHGFYQQVGPGGRPPGAPARPANDAERAADPADRADWADEIAGQDDAEVLRAIRSDLALATLPGPASPPQRGGPGAPPGSTAPPRARSATRFGLARAPRDAPFAPPPDD